jgi:hypothetical protein
MSTVGDLYILRIINIDNQVGQEHIDSGKELYKFGKTERSTDIRLKDDYYKNIESETLFSFKTDFSDRRERLFKYHIKNIKSFKQIIYHEYYECDLNELKSLLYIFSIIDIEFVNKYCSINNKIENINFEEYMKEYNLQIEKYKELIKDELIVEYKYLSEEDRNRLIYTCSKCSKNFTTKTGLNVHLKNVCSENPKVSSFECSKCSKTFKSISSLNLHIKTVCSDNPEIFTCEFCNTNFNRKSYLKKHIETCTVKKQSEVANTSLLLDQKTTEYDEIKSLLKAKEEEYKTQIENLKAQYLTIISEKDKKIMELECRVDSIIKIHYDYTQMISTLHKK